MPIVLVVFANDLGVNTGNIRGRKGGFMKIQIEYEFEGCVNCPYFNEASRDGPDYCRKLGKPLPEEVRTTNREYTFFECPFAEQVDDSKLKTRTQLKNIKDIQEWYEL